MEGYSVLRCSLRGPGSPPLILFLKHPQKTYFIGLPLPSGVEPSSPVPCSGTAVKKPVADTSCPSSRLFSLLYLHHPCLWGAQDTVHLPGAGLTAVLPYPTGGSLHSYLFRRRQRREYLTEGQVRTFFCQAVAAVHALHSHGVSHGSISTRELLFIDDSFRGRLQLSLLEAHAGRVTPESPPSDRVVAETASSSSETAAMQQIPTAEAAKDIRALGWILYELCCLEFPPYVYTRPLTTAATDANSNSLGFASSWVPPGCNDGDSFAPSLSSRSTVKTEKQQTLYPPISERYSTELADLVGLLLLGDASLLPSAGAILQLPWLSWCTCELLNQQHFRAEGGHYEISTTRDFSWSRRQPCNRSAVLHCLQAVFNSKERLRYSRAGAGEYTSPLMHLPWNLVKGGVSLSSNIIPYSAAACPMQDLVSTNPSRPTQLSHCRNGRCCCCSCGPEAREQYIKESKKAPAATLCSSVLEPSQSASCTQHASPPKQQCAQEVSAPHAVLTHAHNGLQDKGQLTAASPFRSGGIPEAGTPTQTPSPTDPTPQEKQELSGEAAVRAVKAAGKLRKHQQNEEAERQLSTIRSQYFKDRRAIKEALQKRMLLEVKQKLPSLVCSASAHVQNQKKHQCPGEAPTTQHHSGPCTCCCLSPRSCLCDPALRERPATAGLEAAAAAAGAPSLNTREFPVSESPSPVAAPGAQPVFFKHMQNGGPVAGCSGSWQTHHFHSDQQRQHLCTNQRSYEGPLQDCSPIWQTHQQVQQQPVSPAYFLHFQESPGELMAALETVHQDKLKDVWPLHNQQQGRLWQEQKATRLGLPKEVLHPNDSHSEADLCHKKLSNENLPLQAIEVYQLSVQQHKQRPSSTGKNHSAGKTMHTYGGPPAFLPGAHLDVSIESHQQNANRLMHQLEYLTGLKREECRAPQHHCHVHPLRRAQKSGDDIAEYPSCSGSSSSCVASVHSARYGTKEVGRWRSTNNGDSPVPQNLPVGSYAFRCRGGANEFSVGSSVASATSHPSKQYQVVSTTTRGCLHLSKANEERRRPYSSGAYEQLNASEYSAAHLSPRDAWSSHEDLQWRPPTTDQRTSESWCTRCGLSSYKGVTGAHLIGSDVNEKFPLHPHHQQLEPSLHMIVRLRGTCSSGSNTDSETPRLLDAISFGVESVSVSGMAWEITEEGQCLATSYSKALLGNQPTPAPTPDPMPMAPLPCRGPHAPPSRVFTEGAAGMMRGGKREGTEYSRGCEGLGAWRVRRRSHSACDALASGQSTRS